MEFTFTGPWDDENARITFTDRLPHHSALWFGPLTSPGEEPNVGVFPPGGQMAILRSGIANVGPVFQTQFCSASTAFLLPPRQPNRFCFRQICNGILRTCNQFRARYLSGHDSIQAVIISFVDQTNAALAD